MKNMFFGLIAGVVLLISPSAHAQFTTCGQTFSNPGPGQVTVTMLNNVTCGSNQIGVTIGAHTTLNMNGKTLSGLPNSGTGAKLNSPTSVITGPGTILYFTNGIAVTSGYGSIYSLTVQAAYGNGILVQSAGSALISGVTSRSSSIASGVFCYGPCTVSSSALKYNKLDGLVCSGTTCSSYTNTFIDNLSQDIEARTATIATEYHSCPHDVRAVLYSTVNLNELASCSSVICINDGTSVFNDPQGVCS